MFAFLFRDGRTRQSASVAAKPVAVEAERARVYRLFREVLPKNWHLLMRVRADDILDFPGAGSPFARRGAGSGERILDFVVCDAALKPRLVILCGGAPLALAASAGETRRACRQAGLPLLVMASTAALDVIAASLLLESQSVPRAAPERHLLRSDGERYGMLPYDVVGHAADYVAGL